MGKVFTIDVSKCNGCFNCQLACKDEHVGNDWTPYAKPQPEIGQFWMKLQENTGGTIPKVRIHYIPQMCNHCEKPACAAVCPFEANYRRSDGFVILDPEKCGGCQSCRKACPYGAVYYNEELNICQKCTGCAHLLDNGYPLPRCVEACPTEALQLGEEEDMQDFIIGATVRMPQTGQRPRVFYRNIPGKFIAGTVYDPDEKEVITGARCRATNGGKTVEVSTDEYGDFWFNDLAMGIYDVVIEAKGYDYKTFEAINAQADVNLGDIPLTKATKPDR
ncbi:MAG: carboxypeptidase regulatory-like domain-containing protein [Oscillospiraceae bacterium]|nr:carboxypeptidase regulatory-like domain-containing protein [Oscillospiraceae bacterium]